MWPVPLPNLSRVALTPERIRSGEAYTARIKVPLKSHVAADHVSCPSDVNRPVEADNVGPGIGDRLKRMTAVFAEDNHGCVVAPQKLKQETDGPQGEFPEFLLGQYPAPRVEDLNCLRTGFDLGVQRGRYNTCELLK